MANKILSIIYDFFEIDKEKGEDEIKQNTTTNVCENTEVEQQERVDKRIELSIVIDFVREIEAYYTNDIFKQKSDYINNSSLSDNQVIFLNKKIKEYEEAVKLIIDIKEKLLKKENGYKELWRKTSYSFYNELEDIKLKEILYDSFEIVKQLAVVNVAPELDEIIKKRLESYKKSWKIEGVIIPKNASVRIIGRKENIDIYQFGEFQKEIIDIDSSVDLLPEQISAIKKLKVKILFENPANNYIWIRCATINRTQLEYLKKTTFFKNDWENGIEEELIYDIVDCSDIEFYIKSMVQLLLPRKSYIIISIVNPNYEILQIVKDAIVMDMEKRRVKIIDKMSFLSQERTGIYKDNLQIECVSRKYGLEELCFQSYIDFISKFLN